METLFQVENIWFIMLLAVFSAAISILIFCYSVYFILFRNIYFNKSQSGFLNLKSIAIKLRYRLSLQKRKLKYAIGFLGIACALFISVLHVNALTSVNSQIAYDDCGSRDVSEKISAPPNCQKYNEDYTRAVSAVGDAIYKTSEANQQIFLKEIKSLISAQSSLQEKVVIKSVSSNSFLGNIFKFLVGFTLLVGGGVFIRNAISSYRIKRLELFIGLVSAALGIFSFSISDVIVAIINKNTPIYFIDISNPKEAKQVGWPVHYFPSVAGEISEGEYKDLRRVVSSLSGDLKSCINKDSEEFVLQILSLPIPTRYPIKNEFSNAETVKRRETVAKIFTQELCDGQCVGKGVFVSTVGNYQSFNNFGRNAQEYNDKYEAGIFAHVVNSGSCSQMDLRSIMVELP